MYDVLSQRLRHTSAASLNTRRVESVLNFETSYLAR
jgi:hypothetical protein